MAKAVGDIRIPPKMRPFVLGSVGKHLFGMKEEDYAVMSSPLSAYATINEFFTRKIDLSKREVHFHRIISPCEGRTIEYGPVQEGRLTQVKGINYSLRRLLLNDQLSERLKAGSFCNIYLSPRNYHRFHSPCSGTIDLITHIPGACYPVNSAGQKIPGLYTLNERYLVHISNPHFKICLAIVGAAAVSRISLLKGRGDTVIKGEELGMFQMGSSIVMICDKRIFCSPNVILGRVNVMGPVVHRDDLL